MNGRSDKKSRLLSFVIAALAIVLTFALISCESGSGGGTAGADIKGETSLETNADGETVVVATDADGETIVYEAGGNGKAKKVKKSGKADEEKNTVKTSAKATAADKTTTAATQAQQVCYISIDGYCSGKAISIKGGDTAYSILTRSGARVSGSGSYVKGINGLYEFDKGPQSGWKYSVNGYTPNVGAGSYSVKAGDNISWYYVTSY